MTTNIRRILAVVLVFAMLFSMIPTIGIGEQTNTTEQSSPAPQSEESSASNEQATAEPAPDPTPTPIVESTVEPTAEPTQEPSVEPICTDNRKSWSNFFAFRRGITITSRVPDLSSGGWGFGGYRKRLYKTRN